MNIIWPWKKVIFIEIDGQMMAVLDEPIDPDRLKELNDFMRKPYASSRRTFGTHTVRRSLDLVITPPPQPKSKQRRRRLKPKRQKPKQRRPKHQKRPKPHKQRM